MPVTSLKVMRGKIDNPRTAAAKAVYSISDDPDPLHNIRWIPRYLELFAEIRRIRIIANQLKIPTRVYLSGHDEMVSLRSARWFPSCAGVTISNSFSFDILSEIPGSTNVCEYQKVNLY